MALHRVGDADAADEKRGQADQRQELGEALDIALQRRRRVVAIPDLPAGVGKFAPGRGGDGGAGARACAWEGGAVSLLEVLVAVAIAVGVLTVFALPN